MALMVSSLCGSLIVVHFYEVFPMQAPVPGRYRHFKGGYYQVLALALHTETQEQPVIYQSEQDGQVYARLVAMFMEWIEHQGQVVSRFAPAGD